MGQSTELRDPSQSLMKSSTVVARLEFVTRSNRSALVPVAHQHIFVEHLAADRRIGWDFTTMLAPSTNGNPTGPLVESEVALASISHAAKVKGLLKIDTAV